LCHRLSDASKSKLQIVLVMPDGADSPKEDFVLGNRQRAIRHLVANFARHFGHEFRLLTSSASTPEDPALATFIHSKLVIVDDEFSSIGSANFTNRSMRVDFELNAAWEARLEDGERSERLRADLRALRASLLAEHAGTRDAAFFEPIEDLVQRLDLACKDPGGKLQSQAVPEAEEDNPLLIAIFDPSGPLDWETLDQSIEEAFDSDDGFVKRTAQKLGQRLGVIDVDK
jgi:phospholipase D1/2